MKLVSKTCSNPDCEYKDDLPKAVRFCPKCEWEMRDWKSRFVSKSKPTEEVTKKKKRPIGLVCPQCGYEYPGRASRTAARFEMLEAKDRERKRKLKEGIKPS